MPQVDPAKRDQHAIGFDDDLDLDLDLDLDGNTAPVRRRPSFALRDV